MTEITVKDKKRAVEWAVAHYSHVQDLLACGALTFPPTGNDCLRPELWKPAHWRWLFLDRQGILKNIQKDV